MIQELTEIYERHDRTLHKVIREAPATAGLFGLGEDPRKHPCHRNLTRRWRTRNSCNRCPSR